MRLFISIMALGALLVGSGFAWAGRCLDYPAGQIVWCDDIDSYCQEVWATDPWLGYPPLPANICTTASTMDTDPANTSLNLFDQSMNWPFAPEAVGYPKTQYPTKDVIPSKPKPSPPDYPESITPPYHVWFDRGSRDDRNTPPPHTPREYLGTQISHNFQNAIEAKWPGATAVNGSDANPLVLKVYWYYEGSYTSEDSLPLYVELALDDDRAPTDYVESDCSVIEPTHYANDCTCYHLHRDDATCATGTCEGPTCAGSCSWGECVNGYCDGGGKNGQACTTDQQCGKCVGGPRDGWDCTNSADTVCKACDGGTNQGNSCSINNDCPGKTCTNGPRIGQTCLANEDCGSCVGGGQPGTTCTADLQCQQRCASDGSEDSLTTCDTGTRDGLACTADSQCTGPAFPTVCQQMEMQTHIAGGSSTRIGGSVINSNCPTAYACNNGTCPGNSSKNAGLPCTQDSDCNDGVTSFAAPRHNAIALGILSFLDPNPCGPSGGEYRPVVWHINAFDGQKWRQMWNGNPPVQPECNTTPGRTCNTNFNQDTFDNWYELTVKTNTITIKHAYRERTGETTYGDHKVSIGTLPRYYTGPFNTIRHGIAPGCKLSAAKDWTCDGPREPFGKWIDRRSYNGGDHGWPQGAYMDSPVLLGGERYLAQGACCHSNGSCDEVLPADCQAVGDRFDGSNSHCGTLVCCARMPFDADHDGDVDMDDFAALQRCVSSGGSSILSGCGCFDTDHNNVLDGTDVTRFTGCASGPNVAFDPGCVTW